MSVKRVEPDDPIVLAFAPAHKAAMGLAIGVAAGLSCFLLTAVPLLWGRPDTLKLELLANYFYGYEVSWRGALIGAAWAAFVGFIVGWFFAFVRNLLLAIKLVALAARADLAQTRDFMDHI